jgi:NADPH2:quinone reductase
MKAFALESSEGPARTIDIPKPEVGEAGALIAVKAASVNGIDVYQATGALAGMIEHAFPTVVGRDFAGVVESVGPGFRGFAVGNEVLGFIPTIPPLKRGTFAEYIGVGPALVLARKPAGLGFRQAAALPLAGSAALDLLEAVAAKNDDVVLIVGATGGVGSFAVQLAAQRGLTVIATALPDQREYVRQLGAAETRTPLVSNVDRQGRQSSRVGFARMPAAFIGDRRRADSRRVGLVHGQRQRSRAGVAGGLSGPLGAVAGPQEGLLAREPSY